MPEPTAHEVIARALAEVHQEEDPAASARWYTAYANAVLAALRDAGYPVDKAPDKWEWGVRESHSGSGYVACRSNGEPIESEADAHAWADCTYDLPMPVVRRRPAGPWEVAP